MTYLGLSSLSGQIEISEISSDGFVELINTGNTTVDVSEWWLCDRPRYTRMTNLTLECGNLEIAPQQTVTVSGFNLNPLSDELGVYSNSNFGSVSGLEDYVIWGSRGGSTREAVAAAAGIWTSGDRADTISMSLSLVKDVSLTGVGAYSIESSTICDAVANNGNGNDCDADGGTIVFMIDQTQTNNTSICVDGNPDPLDVVFTTNPIGNRTGFIITDDRNNILVVPSGNGPFDLDDLGVGTCFIWSVAYSSGFSGATIGNNLSDLQGCFDLSEPLTVYRESPDGGMVALLDGSTEFSQCAGQITFDVTHRTTAQFLSYWYIITDEDNNIIDWVNSAESNTIDLSSAPAGTCRVWGWSYRGLDDPIIGQPISQLTDDDCEAISNNFITVHREIPDGGRVTLLDGSTEFAQCAGQIVFDVTHTTTAPNLSYWYIITDTSNIIVDWVNSAVSTTIDLSDAPAGTCRVWGWNYRGLDDPIIGASLSSLRDDFCEDVSDEFITVHREIPDGGRVTLLDGSTEFAQCAGQIVFDVTHTTTAPNLSYWYIITDTSNIIVDWVNSAVSTTIDLSDAPAGTCRVWGWNYRGLDDPIIGASLSSLRDDFCEDVSDEFITVYREVPDGGTVSLVNGDVSYTAVAGNIVFDVMHETTAPFLSYWYIITDENDNIIDWVNSTVSNTVDLSSAPAGTCRVWGWNYRGLDDPIIGESIATLTDDFCEDISNNFIVVTRLQGQECDVDAGSLALSDGRTSIQLCAANGRPDLLSFRTQNVRGDFRIVVTNAADTIIALPTTNIIDVDGMTGGEYRVYVLAYDGATGIAVGNSLNQIRGCFDLSNAFVLDRIICDSVCQVPLNLRTQNIAQYRHRIVWDRVPGAIGYELLIGFEDSNRRFRVPLRNNNVTVFTTSSRTILVRVRAVCGTNINSEFSDYVSFRNTSSTNSLLFKSSNSELPSGKEYGEFIIEESDLLVYPNPTSELINVNLDNNNAKSVLQIFDGTGKLVHKTTLPIGKVNKKINVSQFEQGIYQVIVTSDAGLVAQARFVKI